MSCNAECNKLSWCTHIFFKTNGQCWITAPGCTFGFNNGISYYKSADFSYDDATTSSAVSTTTYSAISTCNSEKICFQGLEWWIVRYLPASSAKWFTCNDNLKGTCADIGDCTASGRAAGECNIKFDGEIYSNVRVATGD
jgi:hypothetical protein